MNHTHDFTPRSVRVESRMTKLIQRGRARFEGACLVVRVRSHDELRIRPSFTSRAYRAAVEIHTRRQSGLVAISDTRRGKPYDVILDCPTCWGHEDFILETWSPATPYDNAKAWGHCYSCFQPVTLERNQGGHWSADYTASHPKDLARHHREEGDES